jgi:hypothetical protein
MKLLDLSRDPALFQVVRRLFADVAVKGLMWVVLRVFLVGIFFRLGDFCSGFQRVWIFRSSTGGFGALAPQGKAFEGYRDMKLCISLSHRAFSYY